MRPVGAVAAAAAGAAAATVVGLLLQAAVEHWCAGRLDSSQVGTIVG